jgi:Ca-activated chloride channel homolog
MSKLRFLSLVLGCAMFPTEFLLAQAGPNTDKSSTVARPRKKDGDKPETEQEKIPSKLNPKKDKPAEDGIEDAGTVRSEATTVNVDATVLVEKNGQFIDTLKGGNFRITEDGVPQQIKTFTKGEGNITICLVIEFTGVYHQYWVGASWQETLMATYGFVETLKPEDYVAVIAFDLKPTVLSDFSNNRQDTLGALNQLRIPGFSEINTFDALADTVDRMKTIEGRKAILFLGTGLDTFSKLTFDKARRIIQQGEVPVYAIGTMQAIRIMYEQFMGASQRLDFLQADNTLRTFAKESGGLAFFPRFMSEYPAIFRNLNETLRNQYQMTYQSTNPARDGKYRKIKVEIVGPDGSPLAVKDEKGKTLKYQIFHKPGYNAPREVE